MCVAPNCMLKLCSAWLLAQSTALVEVWQKLHAEVAQTSAEESPPDAILRRRIESSLHPDRMMVFVLDLQSSGALRPR